MPSRVRAVRPPGNSASPGVMAVAGCGMIGGRSTVADVGAAGVRREAAMTSDGAQRRPERWDSDPISAAHLGPEGSY